MHGGVFWGVCEHPFAFVALRLGAYAAARGQIGSACCRFLWLRLLPRPAPLGPTCGGRMYRNNESPKGGAGGFRFPPLAPSGLPVTPFKTTRGCGPWTPAGHRGYVGAGPCPARQKLDHYAATAGILPQPFVGNGLARSANPRNQSRWFDVPNPVIRRGGIHPARQLGVGECCFALQGRGMPRPRVARSRCCNGTETALPVVVSFVWFCVLGPLR